MVDLMQQTRELLPCPFCGGEAERIDFGPDAAENEGGSCIACRRCQASGPVEFGFKENFIANWNTRAALRATPEWQPMETAPRDGTVVLVAIGGSDIPQPCRFRGRVGWVIARDEWRIPAHDGPLGWMPLPAAARPQGGGGG